VGVSKCQLLGIDVPPEKLTTPLDFPKGIPFPKPPSTLSLAEPPLRLTEPLAGGFKFKFQLEVQLRLTICRTQLFTMSESSSNKYYKTQKLRPEPRPRLSHASRPGPPIMIINAGRTPATTRTFTPPRHGTI